MRVLIMFVTLFLIVARSDSITWDFDTDGDAQGWVATWALEGVARLRWAVQDGAWRVQAPPYNSDRPSGMMLISPLVGHDSALFDQVRIRFRVVHAGAPYRGGMTLYWRNEHNRASWGNAGYYVASRGVEVITGEWQEAVIGDLREGADCGSFLRGDGTEEPCYMAWEGELLDVRLGVSLRDGRSSAWPVGPAEIAEAVEIDWIRLTGPEEQLQGELPPPEASGQGPKGALFEPAQFQLVGPPNLGFGGLMGSSGALGDVDGDGDADVVAVWFKTLTTGGVPVGALGWVQVFGDGTGSFAEVRDMGELGRNIIVQLDGADFDGDGDMELVLKQGSRLQVLDHSEEEGWHPIWTREDARFCGVGDADGDGDEDLWYRPSGLDVSETHILLSEAGGFQREVRIALGTDSGRRGPSWLVAGLGPDRVTGGLWARPADDPGLGYEVAHLTAGGQVAQERLATAVHPRMVRGVGDLDGDGDVDLLVAREYWQAPPPSPVYVGLRILRNRGDGTLDEIDWQDEVGLRGVTVVVALGRQGQLPQVEGRYPLSDGIGGPVLAGDVNGDGHTDLVVLEPAGYEGGGLHVLLNRGATTAIANEAAAVGVPTDFRLGSNYPNPFNPGTWIPVEVPEGAGVVDLQVFDILGRPVRTLVTGRLQAGRHLVPWDGRDRAGLPVAPGVYLYRLEVGAARWVRSGKMVKVE